MLHKKLEFEFKRFAYYQLNFFQKKTFLYNDYTESEEVWDTKVQQFHGGQDWRYLDNFVEDFSVTTNALGTSKDALEAAKEAVSFLISLSAI